MNTLTAIVRRGILAAAVIGGLAVVADGAVRAELERAVRGTVAGLPALGPSARAERTRAGAVVRVASPGQD